MQLPQHISVDRARLPQSYEAAKNALANCMSIDECQTWANKAEALASYAKQSNDDTLRKPQPWTSFSSRNPHSLHRSWCRRAPTTPSSGSGFEATTRRNGFPQDGQLSPEPPSSRSSKAAIRRSSSGTRCAAWRTSCQSFQRSIKATRSESPHAI